MEFKDMQIQNLNRGKRQQMAETEQQDADFVTILSSEMIANIVEEHFNKKVYKQKVKVVECQSTDAGYMFSLTFVQTQTKNIDKHPVMQHIVNRAKELYNSSEDARAIEILESYDKSLKSGQRDSKGKFVKRVTT